MRDWWKEAEDKPLFRGPVEKTEDQPTEDGSELKQDRLPVLDGDGEEETTNEFWEGTEVPILENDPEYHTEKFLDENTDVLDPGDYVTVYAPYQRDERYLGMEGYVIESNHPNYVVDFNGDRKEFDRQSIEVLFVIEDPREITLFEDPIKEGAKSTEDGKPASRKDLQQMGFGQTEGEQADSMSQNVIAAYESLAGDEDLMIDGLDWYPEANEWAAEIAETYGFTPDMVVSVTAVLSPQKYWELNREECKTFCEKLSRKLPESERDYNHFDYRILGGEGRKIFATREARQKCQEILDGRVPPDHGPTNSKTISFYNNIMGHLNDYVTIDTWAVRVALGSQYPRNPVTGRIIDKPSASTYNIFSEAYYLASIYLGDMYGQEIMDRFGYEITPAAVQAVTWVKYRDSKDHQKGVVKELVSQEEERISTRREKVRSRQPVSAAFWDFWDIDD